MSTPRTPDDAFAREHAAVSKAYSATREPHAGPRPAIDAAIRAAARRQVKSGPRAEGSRLLPDWTRPLAAAAVVVLTVSVVFVAIDNDPSLRPTAARTPGDTTASVAESLTKHTASVALPAEPARPAASQPRRADALADRRPETGIAATPTEPKTDRIAPTKANAEAATASREHALPPAAPAAALVAPAPAAKPDLSSAAAIVPPQAGVAQETKLADVAMARRVPAAAPAAVKSEASGTGIAAKVAAAGPESLDATRSPPHARDSAIEAEAGLSPQRAKVAAAPVPVPAQAKAVPDASEAKTEAPADWLKRILQLRKSGDLKAFSAELEKFRRAHPDFPLPEELRLAR